MDVDEKACGAAICMQVRLHAYSCIQLHLGLHPHLGALTWLRLGLSPSRAGTDKHLKRWLGTTCRPVLLKLASRRHPHPHHHHHQPHLQPSQPTGQPLFTVLLGQIQFLAPVTYSVPRTQGHTQHKPRRYHQSMNDRNQMTDLLPIAV